jgi:hypothetical protein
MYLVSLGNPGGPAVAEYVIQDNHAEGTFSYASPRSLLFHALKMPVCS